MSSKCGEGRGSRLKNMLKSWLKIHYFQLYPQIFITFYSFNFYSRLNPLPLHRRCEYQYLRTGRVKESQLKLFKRGWVNAEIVRGGGGGGGVLEGLTTSKILIVHLSSLTLFRPGLFSVQRSRRGL